MVFQPGQSGNPSGRRKKTAEDKALEVLAKEHAADALNVLVSIAKDKEAPASARVSAANSIIERGYGKPMQPIENTLMGADGLPVTPTIILTGHAEPASAPEAVDRAPHVSH